MRYTRRGLLFLVVLLLALGAFCPQGWAQRDPLKDEYNLWDLLVARPLGIAAGIAGTAVFVVSLPFTIPTQSVDKAAQMFIVEPFNFSFVREFPDNNIVYDLEY